MLGVVQAQQSTVHPFLVDLEVEAPPAVKVMSEEMVSLIQGEVLEEGLTPQEHLELAALA
jgi:sRNA-binding carbon storage regulator CsrA